MIKESLFPNEVIAHTSSFTIFQDCEVPIAGFFVIAANRGIHSMGEFNELEQKEFTELIVDLRKKMKDVLSIEHVYVFQNEDSEHNFHVWMFPRHEWMKQFGTKIESVRKIMEYAKAHMNTQENMLEVRKAISLVRKSYF